MAKQRTKIVKIRLTPSEHDQLMERKSTLHLAQWMREVCLAPDGKGTSPKRPPFKTKKSQQALLESIDQSLKQLCDPILNPPNLRP